jgi:hypothetical protein
MESIVCVGVLILKKIGIRTYYERRYQVGITIFGDYLFIKTIIESNFIFL